MSGDSRERFTFNNILTKTSDIRKAKFYVFGNHSGLVVLVPI